MRLASIPLISFALAIMKRIRRAPPRPKGVSRGRATTNDAAYYKNGKPRAVPRPTTNAWISTCGSVVWTLHTLAAQNPSHRRGSSQAVKAVSEPWPSARWHPYSLLRSSYPDRLPLYRLRFFDPPIDNRGKTQKFTQPGRTDAEVYFDPQQDWGPIFKSSKTPLWITEGEIKALAMIRAGFETAGLGGVDSFGGENLTPLLQKIKWKDRNVYIVYDSDVSTKDRVKYAREKLARILKGEGPWSTCQNCQIWCQVRQAPMISSN